MSSHFVEITKKQSMYQFKSNLFSLMRWCPLLHVEAQFLPPLKRFPLHPQQEFCSGRWAAVPKDCARALTSVEARSWMHIHAFPNGWCEGLLLNCHHLEGEKKICYFTCTHFMHYVCFSSRIRAIYTPITALSNMVSQKQGSLPHSYSLLDTGADLTYRRRLPDSPHRSRGFNLL